MIGRVLVDEVPAVEIGRRSPEDVTVARGEVMAEGKEITVVITVSEPDASVFVNVTSEVIIVIEELLVGSLGIQMLPPSPRVMVRIGTVTTVSVVMVEAPIVVKVGEMVEEAGVGELVARGVSTGEKEEGELPGVRILDSKSDGDDVDEGSSVIVETVPPTSVIIVEVTTFDMVVSTGKSSSSSWAPSRSQWFV